jgi:hypothetical protein
MIGERRLRMKHLTGALAILSLFAAVPALASDISSDRHFAETKAAQARAASEARRVRSPEVNEVKKESSACRCAKSDVHDEARAEPHGR